MTDAGVYPVGTERSKAFVQHAMHLLTPETATSTHYFWSIIRNFRIGEEALTDTIRDAITATFNEDKAILEIQQRQLEALNITPPNVAIRLDQAPMRARRLLDACLKREAQEPGAVIVPVSLVQDMAEPEAASA